MKVTFPHMGNLSLVVKALFESLDVEFISPPPCSKHTLEIGTKYAPEMACLPLKINIGNFIESIEKGADTIVMFGGCGPCRFGYYGEVEREILRDLGFKLDFFMLEPPKDDFLGFLNRINKLIGDKSLWEVPKAIKNATNVAIALDKLDKLCFKVRPCEQIKGQTDWVMKKFKHQINKVNGYKDMTQVIQKTEKELTTIEKDMMIKPLKIGIVGEIYTIIEPFTNINIEQMLGNMGIEIDRSLTISHWIVDHMLKPALHIKPNMPHIKAAKPYLSTMIGGHAQETIGHSVIYAREGFDGLIQIYPLTCMPEIVAQSILPTVSSDLNIPILTLVIDEMTGEAGYKTRIEAFVDMISRRREIKTNSNEYLLSGH